MTEHLDAPPCDCGYAPMLWPTDPASGPWQDTGEAAPRRLRYVALTPGIAKLLQDIPAAMVTMVENNAAGMVLSADMCHRILHEFADWGALCDDRFLIRELDESERP